MSISETADLKKPIPSSRKGDLTKGEIKKHLIRLTLPMTWGIFAIISFQLVDTFYVSLLGTKELAALSFTFPITMAIFSLFIGFQIATSSVVSRLIGSGDMGAVKRIVLHALILVFVLGVITAFLGLVFHDVIFSIMGASAEMRVLIWEYMHIWFAGAIFVTLPMVSNASMRASGDSMTPAIVMTVVALINIILDPILIFGMFGFPRLEIQGAALATIFANSCAMVVGLYINYFRKGLIANPFSELQLHLFWDSAKRFLFIALPAGLTSTIQPIVNAFIMALLAGYSTDAVAAYGVVTRIEAFALIILMALATGMSPIIGQNWGAKNYDRVHETLKIAINFSIVWSIGVAIILGVFAKPIASIFSDSPEMIGYATLFFWMVPFSYAFGNLVMGWGAAFNAMGMPQRSLLMIVVKMLILMLPAIYIGEYFYGVAGMFAAMAVVNIISGALFHILNWRKCNASCEGNQGPAGLDQQIS